MAGCGVSHHAAMFDVPTAVTTLRTGGRMLTIMVLTFLLLYGWRSITCGFRCRGTAAR
jgi:hypothetical protein